MRRALRARRPLSARARRVGLAAAAATVAVAVGLLTAGPALAAPAGDTPAGFWYGTDSATVTVSGSAPYKMPVIGGSYGGYVGMNGNWARWQGCKKIQVWSDTNAAQARTNYNDHLGIGVAAYWFMAGPGVDPHYNGTTSEAYKWGQDQAKRTLANATGEHLNYPVIFMDIEIPGDAPDYTPADDNGWNSVYSSPCSGVKVKDSIPATVDRADLNGYAAWLTAHSSYKAGVYSAPDIWSSIFGTGSSAAIPNTYEWTYEAGTTSLAHPPSAFCLSGSSSGTCARFFGTVTAGSTYALMWQWSGGGGLRNGYGDFDQIDGKRTP